MKKEQAATMNEWPDRIVSLPLDERERLRLIDSDRYWTQVRAEHGEEARQIVRARLDAMQAQRRQSWWREFWTALAGRWPLS